MSTWGEESAARYIYRAAQMLQDMGRKWRPNDYDVTAARESVRLPARLLPCSILRWGSGVVKPFHLS